MLGRPKNRMPSSLYMGVLVVSDCNPMDCSLSGSSVHGDSPGKNTGVSCHVPLQGTFPTQGWNLSLPHCRQILYRWQCMVLKTKATIYLQGTLREVVHQLEKLSSISFWLSHVYVPSLGLNFLIYINKLLENQMLRRSFLALWIYFSHTNTYRRFLCITWYFHQWCVPV